jgi:hypothetical protein
MSTPIQSFVLNVHNLIYPLALPNVFHKEIVIPPVFVSLIENVIEQNLVGFPNSIHPYVGPYTSYFGFSYGGMGSALIIWPLMSDPLTNLTAPPKLILGVTQVGIVIDCGEPLDEENDSSKRKHNLRMPRIVLTKKPYHERRGKPSPIKDVGGLFTCGWNVPTSNSGGEPFGGGGN